ncbi:MAG: response regulator [Thermodesulfobacteria bacterium]|nr:response regulator [Thermodesulfobacteriota bacterium]
MASSKSRILIAEDDHWLRSSLEEALKKAGYELIGVAQTGKEAVALALERNPDVVLMDIRMPEMDGLEAAKRINEHRFVPIVLLTAYADPEFLRRAKEAKVLGYLMKPVSVEELVSALEIALSVGQEISFLEGQINDLRKRLEERKIIERAKGFLMDAYGMKEGEAMRFLQQEARKRRLKLVEVARAILRQAENLVNSLKG